MGIAQGLTQSGEIAVHRRLGYGRGLSDAENI
jgi:hypothetical protein